MTSVDNKDSIKVENVFDYIKTAFNADNFQFRDGINGTSFFVQDNREKMERLLQKFYIEYKKVPK